MSAKPVGDSKVKHGLHLPGVLPVDMRETRGRNKPSVVRDSTAYKNAIAVLKYFKEKGGPEPYEGYTVLNMEEAKKTDRDLVSLKTAFFSFVTELKHAVKNMGMEKEVSVVARDNNYVHLGNARD